MDFLEGGKGLRGRMTVVKSEPPTNASEVQNLYHERPTDSDVHVLGMR